MEKKALITGASGEIGGAIAGRLAAEGYELGLCGYSNKEALEKLADELRSAGKSVQCFYGDAADPSFAVSCAEAFPAPSLLVNAAGIAHFSLLQDMSGEEWRRILAVNLDSVFAFCRAVIPSMLKAGSGRIINISSVWGRVGASMECAYSASKGGVDALTRALAKELAPSSIAVNALACGYIDTKMNGHLSGEEKKALAEEIPAGRAGSVTEVAECVSLLAHAPYYLTGQIIGLDGGWY